MRIKSKKKKRYGTQFKKRKRNFPFFSNTEDEDRHTSDQNFPKISNFPNFFSLFLSIKIFKLSSMNEIKHIGILYLYYPLDKHKMNVFQGNTFINSYCLPFTSTILNVDFIGHLYHTSKKI